MPNEFKEFNSSKEFEEWANRGGDLPSRGDWYAATVDKDGEVKVGRVGKKGSKLTLNEIAPNDVKKAQDTLDKLGDLPGGKTKNEQAIARALSGDDAVEKLNGSTTGLERSTIFAWPGK